MPRSREKTAEYFEKLMQTGGFPKIYINGGHYCDITIDGIQIDLSCDFLNVYMTIQELNLVFTDGKFSDFSCDIPLPQLDPSKPKNKQRGLYDKCLHMDLSVKVKALEIGALGTWDIESIRKDNNDLSFQNLNLEEVPADNLHEIERHLTKMNFFSMAEDLKNLSEAEDFQEKEDKTPITPVLQKNPSK